MSKTNSRSKISELRKRAGLTQLELSQLVGVTETTIANWEKGRSGLEWIERLIRLCNALNCKPQGLTCDSRDPKCYHPKLDQFLSLEMIDLKIKRSLLYQPDRVLFEMPQFSELFAENNLGQKIKIENYSALMVSTQVKMLVIHKLPVVIPTEDEEYQANLGIQFSTLASDFFINFVEPCPKDTRVGDLQFSDAALLVPIDSTFAFTPKSRTYLRLLINNSDVEACFSLDIEVKNVDFIWN